MNKFNITTCKYCNSSNIGEGRQAGQGAIIPVGKYTLFSTVTLYHIICTDCGSILHSYVEQPQRFR